VIGTWGVEEKTEMNLQESTVYQFHNIYHGQSRRLDVTVTLSGLR
jgi:hypothetical protein